jgi:hypothetical protein
LIGFLSFKEDSIVDSNDGMTFHIDISLSNVPLMLATKK